MVSYFRNVEKYKNMNNDFPFGVHCDQVTLTDTNYMMVYMDNEAWGSQAHIHLLSFVKQIMLPDVEKERKRKLEERRREEEARQKKLEEEKK